MSKQSYWEKFYKKGHILKSSSFSKFCLPFIKSNLKIIEFGCGNGRDTYFFGKKGFKITGIDYACKPIGTDNAIFIKSDIVEFLKTHKNDFDVIYSRFFLHSINGLAIHKLLSWAKGLLCVEFRAKDDVPILYTDHYRNNIDENQLLLNMIKKKFDIIYYSKSREVAKYKNENPLIVRIIARRKI